MMIRLIAHFLLILAIFPSGVEFIGTWRHRHRLRHNRIVRRSPLASHFPFPTPTTPVDFQFTAAHYNLSIFENSIGQRALASSPSSAQMVGVWLPRGYHQIQFRIIEGDKNDRFGVSAKRLGNFAFLQLEHKDQMDVLNRELQHRFRLVVRATAKRRKGLALEATASINLEVLDENDNPPMFRELNYRIQLDPANPPPLNGRLVQLEAFDADEGQNGQLYYSLAKPSSHFYIEPRTGWLRTFSPLDSLLKMPPPSNLTLDVRIEDRASRLEFHQNQRPSSTNGGEMAGGQIGGMQPMFAIRNRATVEIAVLGENEAAKMARQKPKLNFRQLQFPPIRHSPAKVGTIQLAQEDAHLIHLELSRLNSEFVWNCAQIERQNPREFGIWLCPPFPKNDSQEEEAATLTIRVAVFRISNLDGRRTAFGDQEFQIRLDPTIGQKIWLEEGNEEPTKIQINETFPQDAILWQFHADLNFGDKRKIRFKLQRPNGQQSPPKMPFELDKFNGQLRLLKMAQKGEWNISVVAQMELGNAQKSLRLQSAPQHFQIVLAEGNDHCPEFGQIPLGHLVQLEERHLDPKTPSDGIILRAKATDRDWGRNGEIVYKLMGDGHRIFEMDPISGELRLIGPWPPELDQIRLKILAMDRGWPHSHQTQLELIFQRPPQNRTNQRENNEPQEKALQADPKMLQNTCQMENRHSPEFSLPTDSLIGQIDQMAPEGTTIGHISAFDRDQFGPNGIVQFWLLANNSGIEYFGLDPISGRLFLRRTLTKLALENLGQIRPEGNFLDLSIEIMAADFAMGQKQKSTKRRFKVRIRGQNVHSPVFDHFAYRIAVREGNEPGKELVELGATDGDWGQNGQIEFRMALEMDWLSVDPDSGKIRAERQLDREGELGEEFTVIVLALDHGAPSKVAFANVTIILDDINDQRPQCARPIHKFTMPEDGPNGMMIGCIGAFDLDAPNSKNSEIRFEMANPKTKADGPLPFRVDNETGCIFVEAEQPLDFEQRPKYEFAVKLWDRGSPPLSSKEDCQVQILLDDVDEWRQPPNFAEIALEASVPENSAPGTDVLRVNAEGQSNGQIRYRLVGGNGFGFFTLNATSGMVSTLKELDHEEHQQFWLTIRAEDGRHPGLHSHQHILVRVLNQNDRLPIFSRPFYEARVEENCPENKIVLKVEATDADEQRFEGGGGGKDRNAGNGVKYSIAKGDPAQNFAIDEQSGYIVCTKQALKKEFQSDFELEIRACDQGGLCSAGIVQIGIEGANSSGTNPRPKFAHSDAQLVELSSQMPVGFILYQAQAKMPIEGKMFNGAEISHPQRIQYALHTADDLAAFEVFRVDSASGNLILERPLPARLASPFTLVISASLSARQQNAGFLVLKMRRRPENEHSPMFVQFDADQEQQVNLPESIKPGDLVFKIEAVDPDPGDFGKVHYSLSSSQGNVQNEQQKLFSLNATSGELRLAKPWPANLGEFLLTIRASDSAPSMPKSTKCHLRILGPKSLRQSVQNVNLHFSLENLSNLAELGFLKGQQMIFPSGANFVFDAEENDGEECKKLLNVHFATGKLQANGIFTAFASLNCSISLISTMAEQNSTFQQFLINLKFLSNEDLNLRLAASEFYGQIQIGTKIGSSVLSPHPPNLPLKLELANSPINEGPIMFRLLSPLESHFMVDQNGGQIRTISTLEFQQNQSSWEFPILAQQSMANKKLKYSQPALVKIALNWPKREGGEIVEKVEEKGEFLDEENPTNFLAKNGEGGLQFPQQIYNLTLRENQLERRMLLSIWPLNVDLGRQIEFTLLGQKSTLEWMEAFEMDEKRGILWVDTTEGKGGPKLDRERRAQFWMGIRANFAPSIEGPSAHCLVQISLEDVNDNSPEFADPELVAYISEAAREGDRLLQVRAKDPDAGMNGAVRYSLGKDAPPFIELNKYDGKMTVSSKIADQKLEIGQQFPFSVLAVDRGQRPANSSIRIVLRVVHRHQPVFSHQIYSAQIDDDPIQYPHPVQQVRAWSSADGAQIRYRLAQNEQNDGSDFSHFFRLDFDRGQLFLLHPLPPNAPPQFSLPIQALDITRRGAPAGNAQIMVQQKFRHSPKFDFKWPPIFRWKVAEDLPVGSLIGRIQLDANNSTSTPPIGTNFTQILQNGANQSSGPIQIDPISGQVRLQSPLDFEQCARMEFQILAQNSDKSALALLQLDILDANDNLPEFLDGNGPLELAVANQEYSGRMPIFVHKFTALDRDGAENSLRFGIVPNGNVPPGFIQMDPENGILTANWSALNGNEHLEWPLELNISLNDGLHSAFILANLRRPQIQSAADFQFTQSIFTAILPANSAEGTSLGMVQARGGNPPYKFGMAAEIAGNESWPISIEESTGRISLKHSLKPSNRISWTRLPLPILAVDSNGQKAFGQFQLKIADENVHFPRWIAPDGGLEMAFDQWTAEGAEEILKILAVDEDEGDRLEYQIIGNADVQRFLHLNSSTGILVLHPKLDDQIRTELASIELLAFSARVADTGNPPHQSELPIRLRFLPKLASGPPPFSRVPQFGQLQYLFAVAEDAPIGHFLGQLQIRNENAFAAGRMRFSIVNEEKEFFALDEVTGKLTLKGHLDAEKQFRHHLVIQIGRLDEPQLISLAFVQIAVIDVNDLGPRFLTKGQANLEIAENLTPGMAVAAFLAVDGDLGAQNGRVEYSLESEEDDDAQIDWAVDGEQGWLQIGPGGLDRERRDSYNLQIVAKDGGGLRAIQPIQIRVLDANDSPPRFEKQFFGKLAIKIEEKFDKSAPLHSFKLADLDEKNGKLEMILWKNPFGMFRVEAEKGNPSIQNLMFSRFPPPSAAFSPDGIFSANLTLIAFDGLLCSFAWMELEIEMQNWGQNLGELDCAEEFAEQKIKISGNLPPGHPIFQAPNSKRMEMFSPSLEDAFQVLEHSALIVLANYHRQREFELKLGIRRENDKVDKNGCVNEFGCIKMLKIEVENANRMAPKFAMPSLTLNVSEDAFKAGGNELDGQMHILGRLEAFDEDWGEFGRIKFEIVQNEGKGPFWVDEDTGVMGLIGELDREERGEYLVETIARDGGGLFAKMHIKINVLDVNDNAPECALPLYQVQLFENDPNGLDLQLEATDKDAQNGRGFLFKLGKNVPEKLAKIIRVSSSGRLRLAEGMSLDFEEWKKMGSRQNGPSLVIEFGVSIHDEDELRPLEGECLVQLVLLDVNDNAPKFELPLYEAQVQENAQIGTEIIQLSALDADSQHFGQVSYTMMSARLISSQINKSEELNENEEMPPTIFDENNNNDLLEHFALGNEDGWLRIARPFDFEQIGGANNLVELRIRAQDGGEPPLSAETMVQIRVLDQNDNAPEILDCSKLTALVQEGIAPGHSLLTFTVQDADSKGNAGPFRLELSGEGADAFAIDPLLNLITTRQLHFAQRHEFHLGVRATDAGGLSSQECPIRIRVQPQSRHPPDVQPFNVQLMALHGEFLGGPLGQIHASDRDPADLLRFSLTPSGDNQHDFKRFSINPENGELFAQPDLLPGLHRFNVSVTDGKFVSQASITVEVIKVDQEALDHSLSIRFRAISAERFVRLYMRRFTELLARLVGVRSNNVRILSIQEIAPSNMPISTISNNHFPPTTSPSSTTTTVRPNIPQKHSKPHQQPQTHRWRRNRQNGRHHHNFVHIHRHRRGQNVQNRMPEGNLDLLVAVQRADAGGPTAQFHRPAFVKQRLEAGMAQLIEREAPGLELVSLTSEVCRRDTCIRGDCRDRLWLDNARLNAIESGGTSTTSFGFIGPSHLRTFECICRQGYAGPNCDVPVNKCSKELCRRAELCIPSSAVESGTTMAEEDIGFSCACPSGFKGPTCSESICPSNSRDREECARQNEAISLLGQGYVEMHIAGGWTGSGNGGGGSEFAASLESRMELTLDFRTVSANAVLMHGQGLSDYHTLRIQDGHVQYEWDCGSGKGLVQLGQPRVDNGNWHRLRVHRMGRLAKLTLENDGKQHKSEGTSPPGSDVLNLFAHSTVLIFGARVEPSPILRRQLAEALNGTMGGNGNGQGRGRMGGGQLTADELRVGVQEGMIGCIGRIALDGVELPKTQPGIRLFNAGIGCDERAMGPCLGAPCRNGGQCIPGRAGGSGEENGGGLTRENEASKSEAPFICQCPSRFTGAQCEIDLNACAAHPCPNGIPCHNLYGDFHCSCPAGFTGKTCQLRGDWDPCVTAQCGQNGKCQRQKTTFTCQCQPGWTGPFCMEAVEIGIGMGEGGKDEEGDGGGEENGIGNWLGELLITHRILLLTLCAICLFILGLTLATILLCRRHQLQKRQQQRDRRHLNGANRRLKKSTTNNGTTLSGSFSKGTAELPPVVVRGGRRRQQQDGRGGNSDMASNPLVPRETPAPGQGTADRPPPPLPPRYHRRDANGTALPTVEVKPMPAANRHNEAQQKKGGSGDENGSLKSGSQSSQNNANGLMGSLRRRSQANGGAKRLTPVPPPRHSSGELATETEQPLRALGRPLTEEEMKELNLSSANSPRARGSAAGSYGRKIDQACTAAANTQKQKAKPLRNLVSSSIPAGAMDADASTSDYLTMKPVHRAKPFMARGSKGNGRKEAEESPPPPPQHRTPLLSGRSSKLYDNPTDACCQEEEDEGSPRN